MSENNNSKTTIDDLAVMVKGGFDAMDGRFDKVENKLEAMEKINHCGLKPAVLTVLVLSLNVVTNG